MIFIIGVILEIPLLVIVPSMMGIIIGIAYWWRRQALVGVTYHRKPFYRRGFPGERISMQIDVENRKLLPISWLRVSDPWPESIAPEGDDVLSPSHIPQVGLLTNIFSLRWFEKRRRTYSLLLRQRGVYPIGPVRLESGDLFGFYEEGKKLDGQTRLTVFPEMVPYREIPLPTDDPFGELRSRRKLYEDPTMPMGIREYQPEDDFRRVHWPASARMGQLQSKVYQPVSARAVVVCLNISTFSRSWEGTNRELLEYAISVTASLVTRGIEDGYRMGLISNSCLSNSDQSFRILPGRSTKHLVLLLRALAGATPIISAPFETFLIREVPRLPYRATLMIVTPVVTENLLEALVRLRKHGRKITLISLHRDPPPKIHGLRILHVPYSAKLNKSDSSNVGPVENGGGGYE